jgi:hypothetical protein
VVAYTYHHNYGNIYERIVVQVSLHIKQALFEKKHQSKKELAAWLKQYSTSLASTRP